MRYEEQRKVQLDIGGEYFDDENSSETTSTTKPV